MRPGEEEDEEETETLVEAALRVLNAPDPFDKARLGDSVASRWLQGAIPRPYDPSVDLPVPDRPARLTNVKLVPPVSCPSLEKRAACRAGRPSCTVLRTPRAGLFTCPGLEDSMSYRPQYHVSAAEVMIKQPICWKVSFILKKSRPVLLELDGSSFCVWGCAMPPVGAIEVGEGEMGNQEDAEVVQKFHEVVRNHFRGPSKPPLHEDARKAAGFGPKCYEPLAFKEASQE